ncbi:MAG: 4,5-DOPA dioxygenase extradiol [Anaerolineae bacterium]|nr:4,5-DOPA dioxygenase extradiol [Anaerolineae bacterium]
MSTTRMPVLFVGHGSPMNAIEDNQYSRGWKEMGKNLRQPDAVVCISAHWETIGSQATGMEQPRTIHDFGGFPRPLFEMEYPAPGSPALAQRLREVINNTDVQIDLRWGLDHGTWSVLCHIFPLANIPVVQLSIDRSGDAQLNYDLGRQLKPLRDENILIIGSGNIVHNLGMLAWGEKPFDWAVDYDRRVKQWILDGEHDSIIHYEKHGSVAALAINSSEHYRPLLYVLGATEENEPVRFYNEDFFAGSISMRCVQVG